MSVNSVGMEGNVPTKAQKNNLSSALLYSLVQTLCSGSMLTLEVCNYQKKKKKMMVFHHSVYGNSTCCAKSYTTEKEKKL